MRRTLRIWGREHGATVFHIVYRLSPLIVVLAIVLLDGCSPRSTRVTLTVGELRDLEQCVVQADDQVDRQNCVERLIPRVAR